MPAKPTWLLRVPDIIEELRALDAPVIDRAACERLFCIRRRRAIDLMQSIGGYQCGRTCLVNRDDLLHWLEQVQSDSRFGAEQQRKQRITARLDELHRHRAAARIRIPVPPESSRAVLPELPGGITLRAGEMSVTFGSVEELLARLYALAQSAADDFEAFSAMIEDLPAGGRHTS